MTGAFSTSSNVMRDLLITGVVGGLVLAFWQGEEWGSSFTLSCLWLALNFTLLVWLLSLAGNPRRAPGWLILLLACAKIPASYYLLYRLYIADYLDIGGLTAGLCIMPVVLVYEGIAASRSHGESKDTGRQNVHRTS